MSEWHDQRFEALYRSYAPEILAFCARRTTPDHADDAAADVFIVALRRIDEVPDGDRALPWLYGVATNVLRNASRGNRRRGRLNAKLATEPMDDEPGPERQIIRNEEHQRVIDALQRLPERDREVLQLTQWEGLTRDQVAEMLFVTRSAIDKRIVRAHRKLARILDEPHSIHRTAPVPIEEGGDA